MYVADYAWDELISDGWMDGQKDGMVEVVEDDYPSEEWIGRQMRSWMDIERWSV